MQEKSVSYDAGFKLKVVNFVTIMHHTDGDFRAIDEHAYDKFLSLSQLFFKGVLGT